MRPSSPVATQGSGTRPEPLLHLLAAADTASRNDAWQRFLAAYSDLIIRAARSLGGDDDDRMNRYAFVLDQLRRDDFRRVRTYAADGRAQFTTWLVLVVRRLCPDEHRQRKGRLQGTNDDTRARHAMRLRLAALVGGDAELDTLPERANDPHDALRIAELHDALDRAIATLDTRDRLMLRMRFEGDASVGKRGAGVAGGSAKRDGSNAGGACAWGGVQRCARACGR